MMRRKLGILILAGFTVLAGTQEAMRQFDGLRSSLNDLKRASLWSGLIVYAQPVSDGKLPAPQIYYLTPTAPASPQEAILADNNHNSDPSAAKPETKNNHVAEELIAANTQALPPSLPAREVEDAAKSELVLNEMAAHVLDSHLVAAPKLDKVRVYEEVARNTAGVRKFKQHADVIARGFVKELDTAKLEAEIARLATVHEQLETAKLKSFGDAENAARRFDFKVIRRAPHAERPERPERIRVIAPHAGRRAIALPEISTIGCEKTKNATQSVAALEAIIAVAGVATNAKVASEALVAVEVEAPATAAAAPAAFAAPLATSTSWALGCDTEPEFSK